MTEFSLATADLVNPLIVAAPQTTPFFLVNLLCLLGVLIYSGLRFISNNLVAGRLSFSFAALVLIFYQVPLTIFSSQVEAGLQSPWGYSLIVNGTAATLMLYGAFSRSFDLKFVKLPVPRMLPLVYGVALILAILSLSLYLIGVPWQCTGLYALLFDPWLTLLAREFSIKLIGSSLGTYAWGAYANTVAPFLVLSCIWLIKTSRGHWRSVRILLGFLSGVAAIGAILITGTKGLLIPLLIMLLVGAYFWSQTWVERIVVIFLSLAFVLVSLIGFELFKERSSVVGEKYDFAACSIRSGTCNRSLEMLDSMKFRDYSLGIPSVFVKPIHDRLICLCNKDGDEATCPPGTIAGMIAGEVMVGGMPAAFQRMTQRSSNFVEAIFNRVFVVPFQVSIWSFMYAETESFDGLKTLPLARRVFGESINIPELVYQKYGAIYSQGDRTSTSTAPTSFFIAYPAFLGVFGFILAVICIISLDFLLSKLAIFAGASLVPFVVGAVLVMSMNFMTSDFLTVMISHGGATAIVLLGIFSLLLKRLK